MSCPLVFFSNRLEQLYENLVELLFRVEKCPFARRLVVVPSQTVKTWLTCRLASDPSIGIAMGIDIVYLTNVMSKLRFKSKKIPSLSELAFFLETEIRATLDCFDEMLEDDQIIWRPLYVHLKLSKSGYWSKLSEKRLLALSSRLAYLFSQYGMYGGELLDQLSEPPLLGWQEILWNRTFSQETNYSFPSKEWKNPLPPENSEQLQVHLFGLSFLPAIQHTFFAQLAVQLPVYYYILSPCHAFWLDIKTDRERHFIQNFWKKKGAVEEERERLEEFLRDRNPLLANLGKVGRHFLDSLDQTTMDSIEKYSLPKGVEGSELYSDVLCQSVILEGEASSLSMLEAVQADILLLRAPDLEEKQLVGSDDDSIQVHIAPSRVREVEILYHSLMGMIEKDPTLTPGQILVMAPNIADYEAAIRMVFYREESKLDVRVSDIPLIHQGSLTEGFLFLLSLYKCRWDLGTLFQLFDHSAFQRKHTLAPVDVEQIRLWMQETGVRWGQDREHRDEILKRHLCKTGMLEKSRTATFEHGMEQLLMGLSMRLNKSDFEQSDGESLAGFPYRDIELAHADLLGKYLSLLRQLKEELVPLESNKKMTLEEWSAYLLHLLETYFCIDSKEKGAGSEKELLEGKIISLGEVSERLKVKRFSFSSVLKNLEELLKREKLSLGENHTEVVRFASLRSLRSIPAQVIWILGMEEENFPVRTPQDALNLMRGCTGVDYRPLSSDEDRYLFLEALLSSRKRFIVSYQGSGSLESAEPPSSLVIKELLNYLDSSCAFTEALPSKRCVFKHPFASFHKSYFTEGSKSCFSTSQYRAAQAFYHLKKEKRANFIADWFSAPKVVSSLDEEKFIDLRHLSLVTKNPLQLYCNQSLGIYLSNSEEKILKNDEAFSLTPLERAILCRELFRSSESKVRQIAELQGRLPLGPFKAVAWNKVFKEAEKWKENFESLGAERLFEVEMRPDCIAPVEQENGDWWVPPIRLGKSMLVGKIKDVTPRGLLCYGKGSLEDILKIWPAYLAFLQCDLPFEKQLLLIKDGKEKKLPFESSMDSLCALLDYFTLCLEQPSPLVPDLFKVIWEEGKVYDHLKQQVGNVKFGSYNEYLRWMVGKDPAPFDQSGLKEWRGVAERTFLPLIESWFPKMVVR